MARARYYDPTIGAVNRGELGRELDASALVEALLSVASDRGHPAAEVARPDGSVLIIGTDGEWAFLLWQDSLGNTSQSVGHGRRDHLTYDYFGSWSEAPGGSLVPIQKAVEALEEFVAHGTPVTNHVMFQPG
jgi:hypothetical protein